MSTSNSNEPKPVAAVAESSTEAEAEKAVYRDKDGGDTTVSESHGFSLDEERRLLRRVDWRLIPMCAMIFMIKSIDVNNVSFAWSGKRETRLRLISP